MREISLLRLAAVGPIAALIGSTLGTILLIVICPTIPFVA